MAPERRKILVVGCGFPQLGLLRFCRGQGLQVVGLDMNPQAVGTRLCDVFTATSTRDTSGIVQVARAQQVDGLCTCGADHALLPTALAAAELSLPFYADAETVRACQHKDLMRARYHAGGAPSPIHRVVQSLATGLEAAAELGLPLVVKPARGWGQRGVSVVMREPELTPALNHALAVADHATGHGACVLEQFVEGREFSVNAYTFGGQTEVLAVTERIITHYPDPPGITFAEAYPPGLEPAEQQRVVEAALLGLSALGVRRGPTYTQVRAGPRGAFLVETALRLGGGLDPDVTLLASGVSLYRRIVGVALGLEAWERCGPEQEPHGGAVGRFLVGRPGRVVAVEGLGAARRTPHVLDAQVYVGTGDTVHPLLDGSKRVGHVLAVGTDRAQAERHAAAGMAEIRVQTET